MGTKKADSVDEVPVAVNQVAADVDVTNTADLADNILNPIAQDAATEDVQVTTQDDELQTAKGLPQEEGSPVPVGVEEATTEEGQLLAQGINVTKTADLVDEAPIALAQASTTEDTQVPPQEELPVVVVEEATTTRQADHAPISAVHENITEDAKAPSQKEECQEETAAEGAHIPPQECDVAAQASTAAAPQMAHQAKTADLGRWPDGHC